MRIEDEEELRFVCISDVYLSNQFYHEDSNEVPEAGLSRLGGGSKRPGRC